METGTVKWFNDAKGFGFIVVPNQADIFVRYNAILGEGHRTLNEGDLVQFETIEGPQGLQAVNVRIIG